MNLTTTLLAKRLVFCTDWLVLAAGPWCSPGDGRVVRAGSLLRKNAIFAGKITIFRPPAPRRVLLTYTPLDYSPQYPVPVCVLGSRSTRLQRMNSYTNPGPEDRNQLSIAGNPRARPGLNSAAVPCGCSLCLFSAASDRTGTQATFRKIKR